MLQTHYEMNGWGLDSRFAPRIEHVTDSKPYEVEVDLISKLKSDGIYVMFQMLRLICTVTSLLIRILIFKNLRK